MTQEKLVVPRTEAANRIRAQIDKGLEIRRREIATESALREAEGDLSKWLDCAVELLSRLFDSRSMAEKLKHAPRTAAVHPTISRSLKSKTIRFRKYAGVHIRVLESISDSLELIPQEEPEMGYPLSFSQTSTQDEPAGHTTDSQPPSKIELLNALIEETEKLPSRRDQIALDALIRRADMILRNLFGDSSRYLSDLHSIRFSYPSYTADSLDYERWWREGKAETLNLFKTILEEQVRFGEQGVGESGVTRTKDTKKVFVVHGHDEAASESVARYLARLGLVSIAAPCEPPHRRGCVPLWRVRVDAKN